MATIFIQASNECNGRCHVDLSLSLDGGQAKVLHQVDAALLRDSVSDDDLEAFVRVLVRIGSRTRTAAQLRTALLNGVTVTI